jgi:hypothetical protein
MDYPYVEHGKFISRQSKDTIVRTNDFDCAEMLKRTSSGIPPSSSSISEDRSGESAKVVSYETTVPLQSEGKNHFLL